MHRYGAKPFYVASSLVLMPLLSNCGSHMIAPPPILASPSASPSGSGSATSKPTPPAPAPTPAAAPSPAVPAKAVALSFSSAPLLQQPLACGEITLNTVNAAGTASPVSTAHALTLTSSSTTGSFWSDAACSVSLAANELTVAAASSSASCYYSDQTFGTPMIEVTDTAASPLASAAQFESISSLITKILFSKQMLTSPTGTCQSLAISTADSAGSLVATAADLSLTLSASPTAGSNAPSASFYLDSLCTQLTTSVVVSALTAELPLYFQANGAGTQTITATPHAGSTASTPSSAVATVSFVPLQLALTAPNSGGLINTCLPINLSLTDTSGVAAPQYTALPLTLTATGTQSSSTGFFYSSSACATSVGTTYNLPSGTSTFTLYFETSSLDTFTLTITNPNIPTLTTTLTF